MTARRAIGAILLPVGIWGLVVPQANLGLPALRWLSRYAFPGEAFAGMVVLIVAYILLALRFSNDKGQ
jgi:hypothetical protein